MSSLAHSINSSDRLGMMLLVAVIIHAVLILGVVFDTYVPKKETSEKALDIIVVRNPVTEKNDEKADFLAQQSQKGGGELEEKKKLTSLPSKPTVQPQPEKRVEQVPVKKTPPPAPAKKVIIKEKQEKQEKQKLSTQTKPEVVKKMPKKISMDQLLAQTQSEIEMLTAEIDQRQQHQSRKPRRTYIDSSTQEYKYASYLTAWRRKVENIGNLNYPDEAKRKKIYGNILMTVVLKPNGRVKSIKIRQSSGHKILDDAAVRIVNLASPFAPFPENIRKETDELVITRTWQFVSGQSLFQSK